MSRIAITWAAALSGALFSCGVEVGNPLAGGGKKGGTGSSPKGLITLSIADAPVADLQHVYFNIASVSALPLLDDGTSGQLVTLATSAQGRIDILDLNGGKTLALSSSQELAAGNYAGVVLDLDQNAPVGIVESGAPEETLTLPNAESGIYVPTSFSVVDGEELKLTIHVDLDRSIARRTDGGDKRFGIDPVAHMVRQGDGGSIAGLAPAPEIARVCAYLLRSKDFANGAGIDHIPDGRMHNELRTGPGPEKSGHDPGTMVPGLPPPPPPAGGEGGEIVFSDDAHPKNHTEGGKGPGAPEHRREARRPVTFDPNGPGVQQDADATCANAFAVAEVASGNYNLNHLWPGEYHLIFFTADGLPFPVPPLVLPVGPGAHVEAPVPPPPPP